tara:strand:- start:819 stop:1046 length:228 start_codon:yes stop_codon:yes gene_type:complete
MRNKGKRIMPLSITTKTNYIMYEKENAIMIAILNGNDTIKIDDTIINLPTPQKSGTIRQQETYARLKAKELLNNI